MDKILVSVEVVHRKLKFSLTKNCHEVIHSASSQGDEWTVNRTDRLFMETEEVYLLHESSLRIDKQNISLRRPRQGEQ